MTDAVPPVLEWLEELCRERIFATGAQLAISAAGAPARTAAFGEQVSGRPMTNELVFNVWCASKPVVALAGLGLAEEHGITLDTQLSSVADGFPDEPRLTLRRVLNHTAGLNHPNIVQAYLMGNAQAAELSRSYRVSEPYVSYSEYVAAVALVDLVEQLSGAAVEEYLGAFLADNGLEAMMRFRLDDDTLRAPLDHVGFYVVGLPAKRVPLYHDALPVIAQNFRPMVGAYASAAGLCDFYRLVRRVLTADEAGGKGCPSGPFLSEAIRTGGRDDGTYDELLGKSCDFAAGFMTDLSSHGYGDRISDGAIGHTGMLGSPFGFYDPETDLAVGVILNGLSTNQEDSVFWRPRLVDLVLETGAWGTVA